MRARSATTGASTGEGDGGGRPPTASPATATSNTLEQLAKLPDDAIDVALGAALIARDVYGNLDIAALLARLDTLAEPLVSRNGGAGLAGLTADAQARALAAHFSEELGFHGNDGEFYDPRNSLLPDVLERRLGIPITLSLVYCEVAKRAGVNARGVGFPGHFLARIDGEREPSETRDARRDQGVTAGALIVDPFRGARTMSGGELELLLRRALGKDASLTRGHLAASSPRAILVRMLTNLKGIYASRGDFARAYLALDRIISFAPSAAEALRERASLAVRLGSLEAARADYTRSLEIDGDSDDAMKARARLAEIDAKPKTGRALN